MTTTREVQHAEEIEATHAKVSAAWARLGRLIAAVNRPGEQNSEYDRALAVLEVLARKEGIPIAIIGGLAAIKYGYQRYTKDIDVVVAQQHLDTVIRVAPKYRIKVLWHDPHGWHKFEYEGVRIEIIPEGGKPGKDAPTLIPSPRQLGVSEGMVYAKVEGWMETKLSSDRYQGRADVVQVLKTVTPADIERTRQHLAGVHSIYLRLFEELVIAAEEEKQQEAERGGPR